MPTYTKLFNSIVTSTIWTEDDKTRIVWITMLAMADQHGEVHASIPGLARVAGVSLPDCEMALGKLLSPDEYSRTPDNEGRRIAPIPGGWELLNHAKYRIMASKEDSKNATAERVRRHRARNAPVTPCNGRVTDGRDIAEAEAEAYSEAEPRELPKKPFRENKGKSTIDDLRSFAVEIGLPASDGESMFHHWEANGWKNGPNPVKDWKAGIRKWKSQGWLPSQKGATTKPSRHAGLNTMEITGNEF
jgi:hypothetical protein